MYQIVGISKSNNQEFWVNIDGQEFLFRLHTFRNVLYCSIWTNGVLTIAGVKAINNAWLLPYNHIAIGGNFRFENSYDDYVSPEYFGDITRLVYYSPEELAEMGRNSV